MYNATVVPTFTETPFHPRLGTKSPFFHAFRLAEPYRTTDNNRVLINI